MEKFFAFFQFITLPCSKRAALIATIVVASFLMIGWTAVSLMQVPGYDWLLDAAIIAVALHMAIGLFVKTDADETIDSLLNKD